MQPTIRIPIPFDTSPDNKTDVRSLLDANRLKTVCEQAACPNLHHCFSRGTATFLIMGDVCTRRCNFCNIKTGRPAPLNPNEPELVAQVAYKMKLKHVVITSVNRDDLSDGGSSHFAKTIFEVKKKNPTATVETLIPDFKGNINDLNRMLESPPHILNHNMESVASLLPMLAPQSDYQTSLNVLAWSVSNSLVTKSGIILGVGETKNEIENLLLDLKSVGVHIITIGQYLPPDQNHAPLVREIPDDEFEFWKRYALNLGFIHVESGRLVRSSYHASDASHLLSLT